MRSHAMREPFLCADTTRLEWDEIVMAVVLYSMHLP